VPGYKGHQQSLRDKFFFECTCERYSLTLNQRRESDQRLARTKFINTSIGIFDRSIKDQENRLHLVHRVFDLFEEEEEEEDICDDRVPRACCDEFHLCDWTRRRHKS
jgi:hypothetical protein